MTAAFYRTDDLRIKWTKVVLPPVFLEEELPATEKVSSTIYHARNQICDILAGKDHRLLVVAGPCSIHDTKAAREYAGLLKGAIGELSKELCIVMRVYFEKPRTTVGWKGLLNDPCLDQSYKINDGLRLARHLLLDLAEMGVPAGTEFLDMISPQYVAGLVSWGVWSDVDFVSRDFPKATFLAQYGDDLWSYGGKVVIHTGDEIRSSYDDVAPQARMPSLRISPAGAGSRADGLLNQGGGGKEGLR